LRSIRDECELRILSHFWSDEDANAVRASWKETERAFGHLVNFLTGTVRWQRSTLIPSFNALVPLVYVLAKNGSWASEEALLARRWLLLSPVHGYFSGSVQTQMDKILRKLGDDPSIKKLTSVTKGALRRLKADSFDTGRLSGPIMSLYLSMLRESDARDWKIRLRLPNSARAKTVRHACPLGLTDLWKATSRCSRFRSIRLASREL